MLLAMVLVGAFNGVLVAVLRMNALFATLASGAIEQRVSQAIVFWYPGRNATMGRVRLFIARPQWSRSRRC